MEFLRLILLLGTLLYGSYYDWKSREVSDYVWIIPSAVGILLQVYEIALLGHILEVYLTAFSIALTSAAALAFYKLGFFGGADAKALIAVSLILPTYTSSYSIHPFASLTVLTNGVVLTVSLPLAYALRNLASIASGTRVFRGFESEPLWKKTLVCFLGYRLKQAKPANFMFSLEKEVDGRKVFLISLLKDDEFASGEDIWVTPGIPLLLFFTAGFILMVLQGDIIALLLNFLLRK